ncbi:MAG: hypothetical protein AAF928_21630, partial [Myxococcota bacterium]
MSTDVARAACRRLAYALISLGILACGGAVEVEDDGGDFDPAGTSGDAGACEPCTSLGLSRVGFQGRSFCPGEATRNYEALL